jgi:hypothetical protein
VTERIEELTVVPMAEMKGDDDDDTLLLRRMADDARGFLSGFRWCSAVEKMYFGAGVGGVVAVFYCQIVRASPEVDANLWVVVGDLPPAYLVTDQARTPGQALRIYIAEMRKWVAAVESGLPVDDLIPVSVAPTRAWAGALSGRLTFLEGKILALWS